MISRRLPCCSLAFLNLSDRSIDQLDGTLAVTGLVRGGSDQRRARRAQMSQSGIHIRLPCKGGQGHGCQEEQHN